MSAKSFFYLVSKFYVALKSIDTAKNTTTKRHNDLRELIGHRLKSYKLSPFITPHPSPFPPFFFRILTNPFPLSIS